MKSLLGSRYIITLLGEYYNRCIDDVGRTKILYGKLHLCGAKNGLVHDKKKEDICNLRDMMQRNDWLVTIIEDICNLGS